MSLAFGDLGTPASRAIELVGAQNRQLLDLAVALRRELALGLPSGLHRLRDGFANQSHLSRWCRKVYGVRLSDIRPDRYTFRLNALEIPHR
jgi:hypothetical protein